MEPRTDGVRDRDRADARARAAPADPGSDKEPGTDPGRNTGLAATAAVGRISGE